LCYRSAAPARAIAVGDNDVAATRLIFAANRGTSANSVSRQVLVDPDGHRLVITDPILNQASSPADADPASVSAKPE